MKSWQGPTFGFWIVEMMKRQKTTREEFIACLERIVEHSERRPDEFFGQKYFAGTAEPRGWARFARAEGKDYVVVGLAANGCELWSSLLLISREGVALDYLHGGCDRRYGSVYAMLFKEAQADGAFAQLLGFSSTLLEFDVYGPDRALKLRMGEHRVGIREDRLVLLGGR